jgi:predicted aspartyl protease
MGQYSGDYQWYTFFPALPIIPNVKFREGIFPSIEFTDSALIDTGADISNVPANLVRQYHLPIRNWEDVWSPEDGSIKKFPVYLLKVEIPNLRPIAERFIDYGFEEVILGRNLLNRWRIVLDPSRNRSGPEIEIED